MIEECDNCWPHRHIVKLPECHQNRFSISKSVFFCVLRQFIWLATGILI
ncbi:hypothetical protein EHW99_3607 [Erwinia amylovora]|uniref:Uncharacterized protein n=2 Tax=Erwinia amylovora TaxID=552 RepID=A0A831A7D0_ERWAM|nr:hypothetical protein EaACW_3685 [Erwinia amylovora ACW56400]QJQ56306.1 hypothetical protein EHX00_3607 [Erwinia amylovora]CBA24095.1 hypothetical protein predicted by Glimmer/Critica [Erwinia amylovora CFBP1430]CCO80517.1 hypothetical protein BN432_3750 [Erwinia amylovora Ea356]CCO88084.1 hypothetical protein BN434_3727 [Erwinia amylovora CFBP 2585]CCO91877.1 hypothetical protein BN435_3737 [Erwinia amylovora 01SFR-BO]CCO95671.1 hypothetical protein BN437_3773 [Erwinia amylovora NBRC 12687